ncbi:MULTISPECIES: type II toxin-antitoxin system VapC family toxin [Chromatiaceae]|jgi:predicted nucleic acid-binding protein|uniref:type II toxin-antitoxin system VapC family toxin n=1 Tax=Chromatiaceae TaxID=1046 RepID=UPI0025E59712|nr:MULTISPECIES: type II toxin-antitoxin system VapC family toxin [Chromatiaceae]
MGFLIDTNVLSELQKRRRADVGVVAWYANTRSRDIYLSVLVLGEVRQGIERLRRRDPDQAVRLERRMALIQVGFEDRILPVTRAIAERWGNNNVPDALPVIDGLLAATALEHDLILVTRNVRDVERCGVRVLNPFADAAGP